MVVGWYHSHPGFGCWLSGVDINTQQSFEALSERAVAVVVDPIQSVKGKVESILTCLPYTATFYTHTCKKKSFVFERILNKTHIHKCFLFKSYKSMNIWHAISNLTNYVGFYF